MLSYHEAMRVGVGLLVVCAGLIGTGCGDNSMLGRADAEDFEAAEALMHDPREPGGLRTVGGFPMIGSKDALSDGGP